MPNSAIPAILALCSIFFHSSFPPSNTYQTSSIFSNNFSNPNNLIYSFVSFKSIYFHAESVRFELTIRITPYDDLANRWFQPLTQLSIWGVRTVSNRLIQLHKLALHLKASNTMLLRGQELNLGDSAYETGREPSSPQCLWNRTTFLTLTLGDTPLSFIEASTRFELV